MEQDATFNGNRFKHKLGVWRLKRQCFPFDRQRNKRR